MDFTSEANPWKFMEQDRGNDNIPPRFSFHDNEDDDEDEDDYHLATPRTSCVSAASFPLWQMMSPQMSWTRFPNTRHSSPFQSPSRPLLYHCLASLHLSEGNTFCITVTKDFLFTSTSTSRIHTWKQPHFTDMGFIKSKNGEIRAILATERLLFTAHGDRRVRGWEMSNFPPKKTMTLPRRQSFFAKKDCNRIRHKDSISCLAYDEKEKLLFTGAFDRTVGVWKITEKRFVDSFIAHECRINAIVINQDDGCVFTCSSDGTVKIWRRVVGETSHILTMVLKFQSSPINALALSVYRGGCFLYSGSSDGLINFWEKETVSGKFNHGGYLHGHHFAILCLVAVEDLILSGSEDATVRIWKRDAANCFHTSVAIIEGHHGPVKSLAAAMESDGRTEYLTVYSASLDQTLKVWRIKVDSIEDLELRDDDDDLNSESGEPGMNPVLSPSWVQRKIRVRDS